MGEVTKLSRQTIKSRSLRTTMPKGIVEFLRLSAGENVVWKMEIIGKERVALVKPAQKKLDIEMD